MYLLCRCHIVTQRELGYSQLYLYMSLHVLLVVAKLLILSDEFWLYVALDFIERNETSHATQHTSKTSQR